MLLVARVAVGSLGYERAPLLVQIIKGPSTTGFVFYVRIGAHNIRALEVSGFVDRPGTLRHARLKYEHGLVRPLPCLLEDLVSLRIDEDVVEHRMVRSLRPHRVAHVESARKENPLPIVLRSDQLSICIVSWHIRRCRRLRL